MIKNIHINLSGNILKISGEIFFDDILDLLNICVEKTSKLTCINVDLGKLSSSNSSVLIFIINYIRSAIKNNQEIKFLNVPDLLIELSKVYNLNKIIDNKEEIK